MAPDFDLTQIQSTLNQAIGQLGSTGSVSAGGSSSSTSFLNSVWDFGHEGQVAANGNNKQKAEAISNIVKNLMGMLTSLGTNENSKATKEVKKNEKNAEALDKKADESAQATEEQVKEIINNIANNTTSISQAIEKIEELGGDKGQIAEAQEQLEEQLEIIEENKAILNDGVSSPEAKQEALQALVGAASVINGLVESIGEVQKEIEAQNNIVENSTNNVSGLIEESVSVITNGAVELQSFIKEGAAQSVTSTTTSVTGSANEIVGKKATAMGSASSAIPFVGSTAGSKLIQIGMDQTMAGGTRISGAATTLSTLTKAIGEMGSNLSNLSNFTNSVGEIGNSFVALVGQYGSALEPVITATGSWSAVADANAQFEEAIAEYQSQNGMIETNQWEQMSKTSYTSDDKNNSNETSSNEGENNLAFNFDTNLFREAFKTENI